MQWYVWNQDLTLEWNGTRAMCSIDCHLKKRHLSQPPCLMVKQERRLLMKYQKRMQIPPRQLLLRPPPHPWHKARALTTAPPVYPSPVPQLLPTNQMILLKPTNRLRSQTNLTLATPTTPLVTMETMKTCRQLLVCVWPHQRLLVIPSYHNGSVFSPGNHVK